MKSFKNSYSEELREFTSDIFESKFPALFEMIDKD